MNTSLGQNRRTEPTRGGTELSAGATGVSPPMRILTRIFRGSRTLLVLIFLSSGPSGTSWKPSTSNVIYPHVDKLFQEACEFVHSVEKPRECPAPNRRLYEHRPDPDPWYINIYIPTYINKYIHKCILKQSMLAYCMYTAREKSS